MAVFSFPQEVPLDTHLKSTTVFQLLNSHKKPSSDLPPSWAWKKKNWKKQGKKKVSAICVYKCLEPGNHMDPGNEIAVPIPGSSVPAGAVRELSGMGSTSETCSIIPRVLYQCICWCSRCLPFRISRTTPVVCVWYGVVCGVVYCSHWVCYCSECSSSFVSCPFLVFSCFIQCMGEMQCDTTIRSFLARWTDSNQ